MERMLKAQSDALTRRIGESLVEYLNRRQACHYLHPYTCGNGHVLEATETGWVCPQCGYRQAYWDESWRAP
jgi:hypothetical protein